MPIKSTLYVNITSGVIGASSVAVQSLTGRRFTSNPLAPAGQIVSVLPGGAADYFGAASDEAVFASQYFGYVSPAPVSRANNLQFAAYAPDGRTPTIFGAPSQTSLAALQSVTSGDLTITLGENTVVITDVDLSAATSFADVASAIQAALRDTRALDPQFGAVTVSYDATSKSFTITGGSVGAADASVSLTAGSSADLAALLALNSVGSVASPGLDSQSPLEAFIAAESVSDSFGSATFSDEDVTLDQAVALAQYVAEQNVKYQIYFSVSRTNYASWADALKAIASVGLVLNATAGEHKESLPMAIMAATDYDRRNATINYMYRQAGLTGDVTDTAEALALNSARINYYGVTAVAGQRISLFQRGFLMGGATAPLDMNVHANEQWMKAKATAELLSLQIGTNKIAANDDGRGRVQAVVYGVVEQAKFNGTISVGKTLSTAKKLAVTDLTGDPEAWHNVQTDGFWLGVAIVEEVQESGIAEYVAKYTLAYSKNDVVRSIEGSHNLV